MVPDYKAIYLTSVMKNVDRTTYLAIEKALDGTFAGGILNGNLENGGVGLAPYHDLASKVSPSLEAEWLWFEQGSSPGQLIPSPEMH